MKVFAIITAALMASAGGGYYYYTTQSCHSHADCPIAKTGGCCLKGDATQSCETPCGGCTNDCLECCDICELCCTTGAQVPVSAAKPADEDDECPHCKTPVN